MADPSTSGGDRGHGATISEVWLQQATENQHDYNEGVSSPVSLLDNGWDQSTPAAKRKKNDVKSTVSNKRQCTNKRPQEAGRSFISSAANFLINSGTRMSKMFQGAPRSVGCSQSSPEDLTGEDVGADRPSTSAEALDEFIAARKQEEKARKLSRCRFGADRGKRPSGKLRGASQRPWMRFPEDRPRQGPIAYTLVGTAVGKSPDPPRADSEFCRMLVSDGSAGSQAASLRSKKARESEHSPWKCCNKDQNSTVKPSSKVFGTQRSQAPWRSPASRKQADLIVIDDDEDDMEGSPSNKGARETHDLWKGVEHLRYNTRNSEQKANRSRLLKDVKAVYPPEGGFGAVEITMEDLKRLEPSEFLNDTIIDYYTKLLYQHCDASKKELFHVFNSFFYKQLAEAAGSTLEANAQCPGYDRVKHWTKVDLFAKEYLFVPIHEALHWTLAIVCHPLRAFSFPNNEQDGEKTPCILHLDSMSDGHCSKAVSARIRSYLQCDWLRKHPDAGEPLQEFRIKRVDVPRQNNHCDCGLFLLMYMEYFMHAPPQAINVERLDKLPREHSFKYFLSKTWFKCSNMIPFRLHIKKSILFHMIERYNKDNDISSKEEETGAQEREKRMQQQQTLTLLNEILEASEHRTHGVYKNVEQVQEINEALFRASNRNASREQQDRSMCLDANDCMDNDSSSESGRVVVHNGSVELDISEMEVEERWMLRSDFKSKSQGCSNPIAGPTPRAACTRDGSPTAEVAQASKANISAWARDDGCHCGSPGRNHVEEMVVEYSDPELDLESSVSSDNPADPEYKPSGR